MPPTINMLENEVQLIVEDKCILTVTNDGKEFIVTVDVDIYTIFEVSHYTMGNLITSLLKQYVSILNNMLPEE